MRYPDYIKCDRCGAVIFNGDDYKGYGAYYEKHLCANCIEEMKQEEDEEEVYNRTEDRF